VISGSAAVRTPQSGQKRLASGRREPQFRQLAADMNLPRPRLCRLAIESAKRLGGASAERPDELAVVLVGHFPRAVIELELLQRGKCPIALFGELEAPPLAGARLVEPIVGSG
jgi:hypothetical protein